VPARVVCISRESGAEGEEVGRLVAERLGLQYVDEEVIARAAERAGVDEEQVANSEERRSRISRVLDMLTDAGTGSGAIAPETPALRAAREEGHRVLIRSVVEEVADEGNAVIVAHAASMALAGREGLLRVLVTASPDTRIMRLAQIEGNADAARLVRESDAARVEYFKKFYDIERELPTHYDVVVNTDTLSPDQAAELVVGAAKLV
jgi:cytidylate kinase